MLMRTHQAIPLSTDLLGLLIILEGQFKVATGIHFLTFGAESNQDERDETSWRIVRREFRTTYSEFANRCGIPLSDDAFETIKKVIQRYPNLDSNLTVRNSNEQWVFEVGVGIFCCLKSA